MAVAERERHELYLTLERVIGKGAAETIMTLLPPVGWADVATKQDLRVLETRMEARMEAMESRMEAMESRLTASIMRTALTVNIPSVLAAVGLSFAAARFA